MAMTILTYASLFYQLLFPIAIWIKQVRPWFLIAGVIFHLGIAIGLGLLDFGILMIAVYSIYPTEERASVWLNRMSNPKNWLLNRRRAGNPA